MANKKRLIDMDDTMNQLRAYADRKHAAGHNDLANGILKAVNYIRNNMVRVDAVGVVHGRWEQLGEADYKCSECGFRFTSGDPITMFRFCRCGAKMDGDRNG